MNTFIRERNEILINLETINYEEIQKFCKKYKIPIPDNSIIILAGLHKARLYIPTMPKELIEKSKAWLKENGFSEKIY